MREIPRDLRRCVELQRVGSDKIFLRLFKLFGAWTVGAKLGDLLLDHIDGFTRPLIFCRDISGK